MHKIESQYLSVCNRNGTQLTPTKFKDLSEAIQWFQLYALSHRDLHLEKSIVVRTIETHWVDEEYNFQSYDLQKTVVYRFDEV